MTIRFSRDLDLHAQHIDWARSNYDGHNRRGGFTTIADLKTRRRRRLTRQSLNSLTRSWNYGH